MPPHTTQTPPVVDSNFKGHSLHSQQQCVLFGDTIVCVRCRYTGDFRGERGKWLPADKVRLLSRDEWAYISELVRTYMCVCVVLSHLLLSIVAVHLIPKLYYSENQNYLRRTKST